MGGDPAVMPAQHQDDPGIGFECCKFIKALTQPVRCLARYQIALVTSPLDQALVTAVTVAGHIADILQHRENPVLQVGRSRLTQTDVIENLVFAGVSGHGVPVGVGA